MDFSEIENHLNENESLIAELKGKNVNPFTIAKIENILVRETVIFIQASYQEQVIKTILTKIKNSSNNDRDIVNFFTSKVKKQQIWIADLTNILRNFNEIHATNFDKQIKNKSEAEGYGNILNSRITSAHNLGNNLKLGSLAEVKAAHDDAKFILKTFESCMW